MKFRFIYCKSRMLMVSKLYFLISLGFCNMNYFSLPTPVRCQRRLGLLAIPNYPSHFTPTYLYYADGTNAP